MEYLAAHLSKIHGLDWHPDNEYTLATSSQDNSVRVSVASAIPAREVEGWWSRSPSAAAEVWGSALPLAGSGSSLFGFWPPGVLSQDCTFRTGREIIEEWLRICLPHICGD